MAFGFLKKIAQAIAGGANHKSGDKGKGNQGRKKPGKGAQAQSRKGAPANQPKQRQNGGKGGGEGHRQGGKQGGQQRQDGGRGRDRRDRRDRTSRVPVQNTAPGKARPGGDIVFIALRVVATIIAQGPVFCMSPLSLSTSV